MPVPRPGYKTVSITSEMYASIENLVAENRDVFDTPSHFVKHAIAELMFKVRNGRSGL